MSDGPNYLEYEKHTWFVKGNTVAIAILFPILDYSNPSFLTAHIDYLIRLDHKVPLPLRFQCSIN